MTDENVNVQRDQKDPKNFKKPSQPQLSLPRNPEKEAAGDRHPFPLCSYVPIANVPTAASLYSDASPR